MLYQTFAALLVLPAAVRFAWAQNSSSYACNNSPSLCNLAYNKVTYLGAHDSPFLRNEETSFSSSGNQFYDTATQLSAGVRALSAQIQFSGSELHVCHTSCDLLDAGKFSNWLGEVKNWMGSNPHEVVTIFVVNGAKASASTIGAQFSAAGLTDIAYTPTGSTSETQNWPTLNSLISSGKRLVNFVDDLDDNSAAPYLIPEYDYIFENAYDVTSLSGFSCEPASPSRVAGDTFTAISNGLMPLMNHILYLDGGLGIQLPAADNVTITNAPNGGLGTLGFSATECAQVYGRAPSYVLVDFFNVGPAITTVDRLNGVTNPMGRTSVPKSILTSSASFETRTNWTLYCLTALLALTML